VRLLQLDGQLGKEVNVIRPTDFETGVPVVYAFDISGSLRNAKRESVLIGDTLDSQLGHVISRIPSIAVQHENKWCLFGKVPWKV